MIKVITFCQTVLLSLCVFDRIEYPEAVTGVQSPGWSELVHWLLTEWIFRLPVHLSKNNFAEIDFPPGESLKKTTTAQFSAR